MKADILIMEVQLRNWSRRIDRLAAVVHGVGTDREYEALVYIDELKALHAIARAKLDEFNAADGAKRRRLEAGLKSAWGDLGAAIENLGS
jgi:hypothetical protein